MPTTSDSGNNLVNEEVTVTGWGKNADNAPGASPVLRYHKGNRVMSNQECRDYYGSTITAGHICIDTTGGHGVCNVSIVLCK
jgi:hypothetical protein